MALTQAQKTARQTAACERLAEMLRSIAVLAVQAQNEVGNPDVVSDTLDLIDGDLEKARDAVATINDWDGAGAMKTTAHNHRMDVHPNPANSEYIACTICGFAAHVRNFTSRHNLDVLTARSNATPAAIARIDAFAATTTKGGTR